MRGDDRSLQRGEARTGPFGRGGLARVARGGHSARRVAAYVRLLILTGLRRNEASYLRWQDYSQGDKMLTVPGEHRKGGRAHVVFLAPLAVDVLKSLPAATGAEPLFGDAGAR